MGWDEDSVADGCRAFEGRMLPQGGSGDAVTGGVGDFDFESGTVPLGCDFGLGKFGDEIEFPCAVGFEGRMEEGFDKGAGALELGVVESGEEVV